jgi:hypothetical protein
MQAVIEAMLLSVIHSSTVKLKTSGDPQVDIRIGSFVQEVIVSVPQISGCENCRRLVSIKQDMPGRPEIQGFVFSFPAPLRLVGVKTNARVSAGRRIETS